MADDLPTMTALPVRNMQVCLKDVSAVWDEPNISVYHILVAGMWITFEPEEYAAIKAFIEGE